MTDLSSETKEHEKLSDAIAGALRDSISSKRLPLGTILREAELARFFKTSREPVSRAVRLLEQEHLISRRSGQGYAVGDGGTGERRFEAADIVMSPELQATFQGMPTWRAIYDDVEAQLLPFLPFGRFRIVESAMADHFSVGRSVIQQVVAHLCERGIAEKKSRASSQLVIYDANFIQECYEVRMELEPAALRMAAPFLASSDVEHCLASHREMADAGEGIRSIHLADLEWTLHYTFLESCPNKRILNALRPSQLPLMITPRMVHSIMGTEEEKPVLSEHIAVLQLLAQGAHDMAALALRAHLQESLARSIERLPGLHNSDSPTPPRYLKRI